MATSERRTITSVSPWEEKVGFSRLVRVGPLLVSAGTLAIEEGGAVHAPGDGYAQALFIFRRLEACLTEAGASIADVVRTRMYITDLEHEAGVGKAHKEVFDSVRPAATMIVVGGFVAPGAVVEIEIEAYSLSG